MEIWEALGKLPPPECGHPTVAGTPCKKRLYFGKTACWHHTTEEDREKQRKQLRESVALPLRAEAREMQEQLDLIAPECEFKRKLVKVPVYLLWAPTVPPLVIPPGIERRFGEPGFTYASREDYLVFFDHELAQLERWQDGCCAICGYKPERLVEDHDHATNLTRGYLCRSCNVREGVTGNRPPFDVYRAFPPTMRLGLSIEYLGGW